MRLPQRLAIVLVLLLAPLQALAAAERVALVIGMGAYANIPQLDNAVRDARDIATTLENIGFEVTRAIDSPLDDLLQTLDDFAFRSETAELALIYFAGHGVQVQGENFLVPVDADVRSNRDIQRQSVSLKDFLAVVDSARKMRIVILDSCRDNPFGDAIDFTPAGPQAEGSAPGTRGAGGLAPASPDRGTLVAFAAKDGLVALDGDGDNSPFAKALMEKMPKKGLEISLMFRQVRDMVLQETGNRQEPHTYGSLSGVPFYLAGPAEGQEALPDRDPVSAWSSLRPEEEPQLVALADAGDTRSMVGLAYKRLNTAGGEFRPEEAYELFRRAAEAGSPVAQFELAKLYEKGVGVEADPARALELFRAAAAQEFPDALNDLGYMHYQGALGLPRDPDKAVEFFGRAADQRHPAAQFNYAALIDDKLVPGKGPEDAAHYLYSALRSGSSDVLSILETSPNMFTLETRRALQAKLKERAFYAGAIDGQFGPGTNRGLRKAYGLEE